MIATIGRNGEVIIPSEVRDAAHLDEGDQVEIEVTEDGVLLRLRVDDLPDPWYYDTAEWEAGVKQALAEAEAGTGTIYESGEEFLEALRQMSKNADVRD
jgi:AbrB family looped-hinge helix DNA binding protein